MHIGRMIWPVAFATAGFMASAGAIPLDGALDMAFNGQGFDASGAVSGAEGGSAAIGPDGSVYYVSGITSGGMTRIIAGKRMPDGAQDAAFVFGGSPAYLSDADVLDPKIIMARSGDKLFIAGTRIVSPGDPVGYFCTMSVTGMMLPGALSAMSATAGGCYELPTPSFHFSLNAMVENLNGDVVIVGNASRAGMVRQPAVVVVRPGGNIDVSTINLTVAPLSATSVDCNAKHCAVGGYSQLDATNNDFFVATLDPATYVRTAATFAHFDRGVTKDDRVTAVRFRPDGKLFAAGIVEDGCGVILLDPNRTLRLETDYGVNGRGVLIPPAEERYICASAAVQPDGRLLLGGTVMRAFSPVDDSDFLVARFDRKGRLDHTFGVDGVSKHGPMDTPAISNWTEVARDIVWFKNKIYLLGSWSLPFVGMTNNGYLALRLHGDDAIFMDDFD